MFHTLRKQQSWYKCFFLHPTFHQLCFSKIDSHPCAFKLFSPFIRVLFQLIHSFPHLDKIVNVKNLLTIRIKNLTFLCIFCNFIHYHCKQRPQHKSLVYTNFDRKFFQQPRSYSNSYSNNVMNGV